MYSVFLMFLFLHGLCNSQAYKYRFRTINLPEEFKNQYISLVNKDAAGMSVTNTYTGLSHLILFKQFNLVSKCGRLCSYLIDR